MLTEEEGREGIGDQRWEETGERGSSATIRAGRKGTESGELGTSAQVHALVAA